MTVINDYGYGWEYRARLTELQDIAAMDRLAAELAPPSALRRYAARRAAGRPTATRRAGWLRFLRPERAHHA